MDEGRERRHLLGEGVVDEADVVAMPHGADLVSQPHGVPAGGRKPALPGAHLRGPERAVSKEDRRAAPGVQRGGLRAPAFSRPT